jgi:DNA-binding NtrC family response regulator
MGRGTALRILVVEDTKDLLDILDMRLSMDGAHVMTASGYNEGLSVVEQNELDIMITDWCMPGMNGKYLIKMVQDIRPGIPIIIMTAFLSEKVIEEAQEMGIRHIIEKPFEYPDLLMLIKKAMKRDGKEEVDKG